MLYSVLLECPFIILTKHFIRKAQSCASFTHKQVPASLHLTEKRRKKKVTCTYVISAGYHFLFCILGRALV